MLNVDQLPYLTADVPGLGGQIKMRPQDFAVEEVPLYDPSGQGTHVYFRIEKIGIATMPAIHAIAKALNRQPRDFGYAGLKDANAVATQTFSIEHIDPARIQALDVPRIHIVNVSHHGNKLKLGHLKGNHFRIKLRQVQTARAKDVHAMLEQLAKRGVPNYFGPQRFGMRGDTWQIGRAMLTHDYETALQYILGRPGTSDFGEVLRARQAFDAGDLIAAAAAWPYSFHNERRLCRNLAENNGNARKAFKLLDRHLQRFYLSAYQSQLFNQIVAARIQSLDRLLPGDLAWRHPQGAVFKVEDVEREQPRCKVFEISPTGPLFGHRMSQPEGEPGRMEQALFEQSGLTAEDWREGDRQRLRGGRRPLRFQPQDAIVETGHDEHGEYIELRFFLESGCYATTVLREICKSDQSIGSVDETQED